VASSVRRTSPRFAYTQESRFPGWNGESPASQPAAAIETAKAFAGKATAQSAKSPAETAWEAAETTESTPETAWEAGEAGQSASEATWEAAETGQPATEACQSTAETGQSTAETGQSAEATKARPKSPYTATEAAQTHHSKAAYVARCQHELRLLDRRLLQLIG
jgi:hypothetical protein